jgi:hypothetical protein
MTKWFANVFRKEGLREGLQTPQTWRGKLIFGMVIIEGNKQRRQS